MTKLVLASTSPARKRLLTDAGLRFELDSPQVPEEELVAELGLEHSEAIVSTLSRAKAEAVAERHSAALVLGCDSALQFHGQSLGKPLTAEVASDRWRQLRGASGELYSGHWLIDTATGRGVGAVTRTTVHFADISDAELEAYVASGEPLQVAGAFTIDGLGGAFIERIEGDYHTVVGLSLKTLRELVGELGHSYTGLWR
jgi:septum formation protein